MRKRNGITIVELMLAVVLISIVMIFIFNLLIDLRQEETLSNYKSEDQINRSVITKTIQDDFLDKGINSIGNCSQTGDKYLACFRIIYADNTIGKIMIDDHHFYYGVSSTEDGVESNLEAWELHSGTYSEDYFYCFEKNGLSFYVQFVFPVNMTSEALKSKMVFDVELLYIGDTKTLKPGIPTDGYQLGVNTACKTIT